MGKIRITLFNPDNNEIVEDRLVETFSLFAQGPSAKHTGPMRVDTLLNDKSDVEGLITYLKQLALDLPISEKVKRKTEKQLNSTSELGKDSITQLIEQSFTNRKSQEDLIEYLRGLNFAFLSFEHLKEICDKNKWPMELKLGKHDKELHKNYQWMVRILRVAKDPINDKIDPQIWFAFKLIGDTVDKVHIYVGGKFQETKTLPWATKQVNFKKPEKFYKFPETMTYKERHSWRVEDRKKHNNKDYQPSAFYERWKPFITILKPLK